MSRAQSAGMSRSKPSETTTPLGSYLVRVLERRSVKVDRVYEVRDISTGQAMRFASLTALHRWVVGRS
jgi:hypothetical protein